MVRCVCFLIFDQVSVEALAAWSQLESTFIWTRYVLKFFILVQAVVQTLELEIGNTLRTLTPDILFDCLHEK